jgi:hypothetical protein
MGAVVVGEKSEGKSSIRSSGGIPVLDETYTFLVLADSVSEDRINVLSASGLPQVGLSFSSYGSAVCKSVEAVRREDQRRYWDVTATFSSEVDESQGGQDQSEEPTEWVPVYETKFERIQEVVTKDYADTAIANSAGQPFETGLTRSRFIPVWEFYQFEAASITDEQVIERNEVVNSAAFKGRAAHTLLCTVMSSVIGYYYGRRLRLTQYALRYDEKNWKHKRLDVGTVYLDTGVQKAYLDDDGNVMLGGLDGSGDKVTVGDEPAVLEFEMYPEVAFSSFLRL